MPKGFYQHKPSQGFQNGHKGIGGRKKGFKHSKETKRKIGLAKLGDKNPAKRLDVRSRMNRDKLGKPLSVEHRIKLSESHVGEKSYLWQGGISKLRIYKHYRNSEYINWRKKVFERDDWTCQECGMKGCMLHPHHIKSYTYYPELRYEVDNGITLCVPCHHQTHWGRRQNETENCKKSQKGSGQTEQKKTTDNSKDTEARISSKGTINAKSASNKRRRFIARKDWRQIYASKNLAIRTTGIADGSKNPNTTYIPQAGQRRRNMGIYNTKLCGKGS